MKTSKIAQQFFLNQYELEDFIRRNDYEYKEGLTGMDLDDACDLNNLVAKFKKDEADRDAAQRAKQEELERLTAEKQAALASILITSGFNFDGYKITKYSGYISGDDVIQIPRGSDGIFATTTNVGNALSEALVKIRRQALTELKEAAYALGCNAVIGVDFDYITLDPETSNITGGTTYLPYVFCVTANGNAVVIEKDE